MRHFFGIAMAALMFAAGATAASAQTVTSLEPKACKGAPGNAAAQKHDHAAVIYDCAGAGGWRIKLTYFGTNVSADFTPAGTQKPVFTLRAPFDIGPRIEWRSAGKGQPPHAAIVRLHVRTEAQKTASALAVLGVSGSSLCLYAVVSPVAPPNQNVAATLTSDELKGSGKCGAPRTIGPESDTTRELIELNR